MKRWVLVSGNTIVNIVDQEDMPTVFTEDGKFWVENPKKNVGPGCTYENGKFFNPTWDPTRIELNQ